MTGHRYFIVNKPVNMVSQFVSGHDVRLLGSINYNFPEGTHAIGRLDKNSEGLLLVTTDKKITALLFQGKLPHSRTYLVQVKNKVSPETVLALAAGITISAAQGSEYVTKPCEVILLDKPDFIHKPETQLHENVVYSWLLITLSEGKFHQVRKMVAAVNHKCIRLIRISIEDMELGKMKPGEVIELSQKSFYEKLKL
jgi:23S rRNA pseudouridine2457 synthase